MKILAQYDYRGNAFQRTKALTLTPDALVVRRGAGREQSLPFSKIAKIDLLMRASPAYGTAYVCRLWRKGALMPIYVLASKSYRGFNDFEPKDGAYSNFVTKLHAAIAKANPACRFEVTVPEIAILSALLHSGHIALIVLPIVFLAALFVGGDVEASVAITIAAALALVGLGLWRMKKFGPWPYDPKIIPDGILPKPGAEMTVN